MYQNTNFSFCTLPPPPLSSAKQQHQQMSKNNFLLILDSTTAVSYYSFSKTFSLLALWQKSPTKKAKKNSKIVRREKTLFYIFFFWRIYLLVFAPSFSRYTSLPCFFFHFSSVSSLFFSPLDYHVRKTERNRNKRLQTKKNTSKNTFFLVRFMVTSSPCMHLG